jgi:hypothetical protein
MWEACAEVVRSAGSPVDTRIVYEGGADKLRQADRDKTVAV